MAEIYSRSIVAALFVLLHRAITRGFEVALEGGAAFLTQSPETALRQGYRDYVTALTTVINAHHMGEDEVAFPALRALIPGAPYDRLMADHHAMLPSLDALRDAGGRYAAGEDAALSEVLLALEGLRNLWLGHYPTEEASFGADALNAVMDRNEQARLVATWGAHSQGMATPPWLALPFVLYNLNPADRAVMAAGMPPEVVQDLVPVVWAEQWRAMRPFLLMD